MSTPKSSIEQLWQRSGGNGGRYRVLMREHGYILSPGDDGYEEGSRTLACGWPPGTTSDAHPPWERIIASLVRQLGRQAAVFSTDIAYETGTLSMRQTPDGYVFTVRDEPVSREGQESGGEPEAIQAAGDAVARMFPGLGPETGRKIAAAVLEAARPHLTRAAFYMEGVKAERERVQPAIDRILQLAAAAQAKAVEHAVAAERARLYAELGSDHYVIFTEDGWTMEHSVECRLSGRMSECAYHEAVKRIASEFEPENLGRWRITSISEGLPDLERADG